MVSWPGDAWMRSVRLWLVTLGSSEAPDVTVRSRYHINTSDITMGWQDPQLRVAQAKRGTKGPIFKPYISRWWIVGPFLRSCLGSKFELSYATDHNKCKFTSIQNSCFNYSNFAGELLWTIFGECKRIFFKYTMDTLYLLSLRLQINHKNTTDIVPSPSTSKWISCID